MIVLVVDPAIRTAEVDVYNMLEDLCEELRSRNGLGQLTLRYWLPVLGDGQTLQEFFSRNPSILPRLAGVLVLGSYAHVTDRSQHLWMGEFEKLHAHVVIPRRIPLLGICFAHQFIAHCAGWHVGYVKDKKWAGLNEPVWGLRELKTVSSRARLLLTDLGTSEWNRITSRASDLRQALAGVALGQIGTNLDRSAQGKKIPWPLKSAERAFVRAVQNAPEKLFAWARHEQAVLCPPSQGCLEGEYLPALVHPDFPYDGLVHRTHPWFTCQTHPERPITPSSKLWIQNFLLLSGAPYR